MAKPQTTWFTPNRNGDLINAGNFNFTDNLGNPIVDNLQNQLVTTVYQYIAQPTTLWSNSQAYTSIQDELDFAILDENGFAIQDEQSLAFTSPNTQWFNPSRRGSIVVGANLQITDNLGNNIVTNAQDSIMTTPQVVVDQPATAWSQV